MKAKLIVEGKEFDIEIQHPELQKLVVPKKTGYERVDRCCSYWSEDEFDVVEHVSGEDRLIDEMYENAKYYSSKVVAENNARADKLMRQLRRFAVEHRDGKLDCNYGIYVIHWNGKKITAMKQYCKDFCCIPFDSLVACNLAIDAFRSELLWYFTEYKDSL